MFSIASALSLASHVGWCTYLASFIEPGAHALAAALQAFVVIDNYIIINYYMILIYISKNGPSLREQHQASKSQPHPSQCCWTPTWLVRTANRYLWRIPLFKTYRPKEIHKHSKKCVVLCTTNPVFGQCNHICVTT